MGKAFRVAPVRIPISAMAAPPEMASVQQNSPSQLARLNISSMRDHLEIRLKVDPHQVDIMEMDRSGNDQPNQDRHWGRNNEPTAKHSCSGSASGRVSCVIGGLLHGTQQHSFERARSGDHTLGVCFPCCALGVGFRARSTPGPFGVQRDFSEGARTRAYIYPGANITVNGTTCCSPQRAVKDPQAAHVSCQENGKRRDALFRARGT
ncbi:hypothetical protein CMUS01_10981 [Colletotrichum musicola]|uniref:Uncharacterized protein n=1 Tax=Colletotrichum musicola TaxID=2175873 RepID=A0A8H6K0T8_9PEZI|nr:hypothetical protein CMUS01_10981 [Colletotrichum musicola]